MKWEELKKLVMFRYGFGIELLWAEGLGGTGTCGAKIVIHSSKKSPRKFQPTEELLSIGETEEEAIDEALKLVKSGKVKSRDPMQTPGYWGLKKNSKKK